MALLNRPNGFSPVGNLLGSKWTEGARLYAIPTADTTNSYAIGDVVMARASSDANGVPYVQKWGGATTTSALPLGIIVGMQTADPGVSLVGGNLALEQASWFRAGTRTAVRYVYVIDDPFVLFEAQFDATGVTQAALHQNAAVTISAADQTSLAVSSPYSDMVLTGPAVTATLPIRLLGAVQRPENVLNGSAATPYLRVLCKWNYHAHGVHAAASGTVVNYLAP
jgi:hypothetical protein